ncbi:glutathione-S-transferase [Leptodontidium sp. MPI-SDFR-AT-0119]|nr:glutathione-S-transferase [Leptodontidium sp. MPI-SDFR-AT-0119]
MATKPTSYPAATGRAVKTVAEHAEEQGLVFWGAWVCLLEINPKGLVPILQNTTTKEVKADSLAILKHLDEAYPSPSLLPSSTADKAIAEQWLTHINTVLIPSFFRLMQAQPSNASQHDKALEDFTAALSLVSAARKEGGPYFFGEGISLVDIAIAPWAVRDFIIAEFRGWDREAVLAWKEWAEVLERRESVLKTTSNREKYVEFNGTFLRDESFSQAAKAARSGLAIP